MKKSWFTITQIQNNIYSLAEFSHWEKVVSYLIVDKTRAFVIDTGMGYASIADEIKNITDCPITVLLTHSHWDHIGGVDSFNDVWVYNNEFEMNCLNKGFNSRNITELQMKKYFFDGYTPNKYIVFGKRDMSTFNHGQIIHSDSFTIECIHTPGHTPGSVCFFIEKIGVLFTGDTIYPGPLYAFLPESNWRTYIESVSNLKLYIPKIDHVLPGHNSIHEYNCFLSEVIHDFETIPALVTKQTKELKFKSFSFHFNTKYSN